MFPFYRISSRRSIANAVRRRLWLRLFESHQARLGSFFLDPHDHIGAERIVMGDRYEGCTLAVLEQVIARLGLGQGGVLDVGANIGNHACWFASRFNHVVCVEPGRVASLILEANLAASSIRNVTICRCALGARRGNGRLEQISAENLGSSVVMKVDQDAGEFEIVPGDDLWSLAPSAASPLELVKIDVEGAETEVVEGLMGILSKARPLVCLEVLNESRWRIVRGSLESAGYTSWYVIVANDTRRAGKLTRAWSACRGRTYRMIALPATFSPSGYDMIICMTPAHVARMES